MVDDDEDYDNDDDDDGDDDGAGDDLTSSRVVRSNTQSGANMIQYKEILIIHDGDGVL